MEIYVKVTICEELYNLDEIRQGKSSGSAANNFTRLNKGRDRQIDSL